VAETETAHMAAQLKSDIHLAIAHVLFMDVVDYSKLLVNEQRDVIHELNDVVRQAAQFRKSDAHGELICIPSGDGMALVFFESPEEPVQCALEISRALKNHPRLRLRMGVHSGPVDQVKDVNNRSNVAGAGINIAQRVMDCGDAGHILVSQRVADDLAQDSLWQPHLHEIGEIEMKHGVKVGIVNVYTEEFGNPEPPGKVCQHQAAPPPAATPVITLSNVPEKSIAVLPFENLSPDPENVFFADGVQDEILTNLAKIADLKVTSRSSVMQYRAPTRNMREIASALGVAHILEGNVQRAGNRVRVSAQLIDARTDTHLWAENYHRPLDDVFAIQSEIAKAVAEQLQAKLSPAEEAAIEQPPTSDLVAYDRYLRGKKLLTQTSFDARAIENLRQGIRLLDQAVAHDPAFYLAYCQLARAHEQLYFLGGDHTPARVAQARQALEKAISFAPERGEAHLAAAYVSYHCELDYKTALAELAIARRGLPNDSAIPEITGYIARRQGHWEQCIENVERAAELDPRNFFLLQQISQTYQFLRRFSDAAGALDRALAASPGDATSRVARAFVDLDSRGETQPARDAIHAVVAEDPSAVDAVAEQWFYLALCRRDSKEVARALASISPEGIIPVNVRMPKNFCEGVAARARDDSATAESAFTAARDEMAKVVDEQPDYAEALSVLGMSEAAVGPNEDALRHSRRAVELFPVAKDAITGAEILRNLAITYAWAGEKDLALQQLEEVVRIPGPNLLRAVASASLVGPAARRPALRKNCGKGKRTGRAQVNLGRMFFVTSHYFWDGRRSSLGLIDSASREFRDRAHRPIRPSARALSLFFPTERVRGSHRSIRTRREMKVSTLP
jgi:TolB-like protein